MDFNEMVTCPFDKAHKLLRGRLTKHLIRCSRTAKISKSLLICPFNDNHRIKAEEIIEHIESCPSVLNMNLASSIDWSAPVESKTVSTFQAVECDEDWDKEPDAPTYNPGKYCENNLVLRSIKGHSKSVRAEFKESERRRFAEHQPK